MLDTYPTSAFDPLGFFDVKALFPHVDELFVMAYDMQDPGVASATAPLTNAPFSDATTLADTRPSCPHGGSCSAFPYTATTSPPRADSTERWQRDPRSPSPTPQSLPLVMCHDGTR